MSGPDAMETGLSRMLERLLALLLLAIFGTVVLLVILRYVLQHDRGRGQRRRADCVRVHDGDRRGAGGGTTANTSRSAISST